MHLCECHNVNWLTPQERRGTTRQAVGGIYMTHSQHRDLGVWRGRTAGPGWGGCHHNTEVLYCQSHAYTYRSTPTAHRQAGCSFEAKFTAHLGQAAAAVPGGQHSTAQHSTAQHSACARHNGMCQHKTHAQPVLYDIVTRLATVHRCARR